MATKLDVITAALRLLGVLASDEEPTADQYAMGDLYLASIFEEVEAEAGLPFSVDAVPVNAFLALSRLLAVDLAAPFLVNPPTSRGMAMLRLLAVVRPDNREPAEAVFF